MNRNGDHDRRSFEPYMKASLVFVLVGILVLIFYSWKLGLVVIMFACAAFMQLEALSRPPENNPNAYKTWSTKQYKRRPTLVCLGDSLCHGNISSNVTPEIPTKLAKAFGMETPSYGMLFSDPIWVINCGQNLLTSHVIYHERLVKAMGVYPDYIVLLIGTNDILGIANPSLRKMYASIHSLKESDITMSALRNNISQICKFIREASPKVELGVCTIPPIGEDLNSNINGLVKEANQYIYKIISEELQDDRTNVVPLYEKFESVIEKNRSKKQGYSRVRMRVIAAIAFPLHRVFQFISWNTISSVAGYTLLIDGVHLNDTARDIFVDTIIDWLKQRNITKVMAIKSL